MSEKCVITNKPCPNERECDLDCLEKAIKGFHVATKTKNKTQKAVIHNRTFSDNFGWLLAEEPDNTTN